MPNKKQLELLKQSCINNDGHLTWNKWRILHNEKIDLSMANLSNINLSYCNLSFANLRNVTIDSCYLAQTNLSNALLSKSIIINTYVVGAVLIKAILEKALLENTYLLQVQADQSVWSKASIIDSDLRESDFSSSNWSDALLKNTILTGTCFSNFCGLMRKDTTFICENIIAYDKRIRILDSYHVKILKNIFTNNQEKDILRNQLFNYSNQNTIIVKSETSTVDATIPKVNLAIQLSLEIEPKKEDFLAGSFCKTKPISLHKKYKYLYVLFFSALVITIFCFRDILYVHLVLYKLNHSSSNERLDALSLIENSYTLQESNLILDSLIDNLGHEDLVMQDRILKNIVFIGEPCLPKLLDVLYSGKLKQKITALKIIPKIPNSSFSSLPVLVKLLKSKEKSIVIETTNTICQLGYFAQESIPLLMENLDTDDENIKIATIRAISKFGMIGRIAEDYFLEALTSNDDSLTITASFAIADVCSPTDKIIKQLGNQLIYRENIHTLERIIWCIGHLSKKGGCITEVIPTLIDFIRKHKWKHGYYAAQALGKSGKQALPFIEKILIDEDEKVRELAALSFCIMEEKGEYLLPILASAIYKEEKPQVLSQQLSALVKIGSVSTELLDFLTNAATNEKLKEIRQKYIHVLGFVSNSPETIKLLCSILMSEKYSYKEKISASLSIGNIGKPANSMLLEILNETTNDSIIIHILAAFNAMAEDAEIALSTLAEMMNHKSAKIRQKVIEITVSINKQNEYSKNIIYDGLKAAEIFVQVEALKSMRKFSFYHDPKIIQLLVSKLNDHNKEIYYNTIMTCLKYGEHNKSLLLELKKVNDPTIQPALNKKLEKWKKIEK